MMKRLILLLMLLTPGWVRAQEGVASWYGEEHCGRIMANGKAFDPDQMTAASWFYPLGTWLRIASDHGSVVVRVTDRGPARRLVREGRLIDLSAAAFRSLANPRLGLIRVSIAKLDGPIPPAGKNSKSSL